MSVPETLSTSPPEVRARRRWMRFSVVRNYGIVVSFVLLFIGLSFATDVFLTSRNFLNILDQSAALGLMAAAGTVLLIAGGFDLSIGAVFALSGVVAAMTASHIGPGAALTLGALTGLGVGIGNGLLTSIGRINPLVATLASGIIVQGFALILTSGFLINVSDPAFTSLGQGAVFGVHYSVFLWAGFAALCGFALTFTTFGRYVYASGGNAEAARLSGIRVGLVRGTAYALSGFSAGLAGVLVTSRVATGQADVGTSIPLTVIAGIVVGGTSILGGEGAVWRSVLGVLLLALIGNGFNLLQVNPIYQQVIQGAIILGAVGVDAWARRSG